MRFSTAPLVAVAVALGACGGGSSFATAASSPGMGSNAGPAMPPLADAAIVAATGFRTSVVARVGGARELAFLPDGDLLVGTQGSTVAIVPNADAAGVAGTPATYATLADANATGVAYGGGAVYVATEYGLWRMPYAPGARTASSIARIASVRTGEIAPGSDGDVHHTSSVAVDGSRVFVGVGSSCNACVETDRTRASIQVTGLDGGALTTYATRIRNPIALAVDPATGTLWAGGAGQDALPSGHPYEFVDAVTSHPAGVDYGWPACEENRHAYAPGASCAKTVAPRVELPAYETLIGAAFYPVAASGAYAFPAPYRGGLFVTAHGSWHMPGGHHVAPRVAFVAMNGDAPTISVAWNDPTAQWKNFLSGFQDNANGDERIGRPTGIAVGPQGSLFVADDESGNIYRVRPTR